MSTGDDPFREANPYAPPEAALDEAPPSELPSDVAAAEIVRKAHLNHEWSIRSLGGLHLIGAVIYTVVIVGFGFMLVSGLDRVDSPFSAFMVGVGAFFVGLVALNFALGFGLRGLRPWARWLDVVLLVGYLLINVFNVLSAAATGPGPNIGVAIGSLFCSSLIPGYVLYLLLSAKGGVVFSPEYKEVIALTPHVKYKTSLVLKIALVLLLVLIGLGVTAAILSGGR